MKRKAIIPLVLGLGIGLFTVKLAVNAIQKAQAANANTTTIKIVRAKKDINAHEKILKEMVEVIETNETMLTPQNERFDDLKLVAGRVSAKAIPTGAPILQSMLSPKGTIPGMIGQIPRGYRAVSVKIDEVTGVAYQLKPGDMVDVIVVMDVDTGIRGRKETIAEVILQNVKVAAIGHVTESQAGSSSKAKPAKSATLFVLDVDVPKLHLASTRGKITLAMRGADDSGDSGRLSADMGDVVPTLKPKKEETKQLSPLLAMMGFGNKGEKLFSEPTPEVAEVKPSEPVDAAEPQTVLVVRGGSAVENMQRITFEDSDSTNILAVTSGAVRGIGEGTRNRQQDRVGKNKSPLGNPSSQTGTNRFGGN